MTTTQATTKLQELKLYEENNFYYFDATYILENIDGTYEVHVPKIQIPFNLYNPTISIDRNGLYEDPIFYGYHNIKDVAYIELEQDRLLIEKTNHTKHEERTKTPVYFTMKLIKEKVYDMTIDEIEKKLGHKIKIVNKKEN